MKSFKLLGLVLLGCMVLSSCAKHVPESKCIGGKEIKISGGHKNLLAVADSAKVLLVCTNEKDDKWDVRVLIPLVNTKLWKNVDGIEPARPPKNRGYKYFKPSMGNFHAEYLDANESPLSFDVGLDWDVIKSLLSSGDTKTPEDFLLKSKWEYAGDHSYKTMKSVYDQLAGVSLTHADLDEVTVYAEVDDDDVYGAYENAVRQASKAMQNAYDNASKQMEDALSSYGF